MEMTDEQITRYLQSIDFYIGSFKCHNDKNTQFYDACMIAKRALLDLKSIKNTIINATQT